MTRTTTAITCGLLFTAWGCGAGDRPATEAVDCSAVESPYEFSIVDYYEDYDYNAPTKGQTGWFQYADPTPHGVPDTVTLDNPDTVEVEGDGSNVPFNVDDKEVGPRCGNDTLMMRIKAYGHNFWGAGFGNWKLNDAPKDASDYEGISFWVRSATNADKSFMFYVDDPRTVLLTDATVIKDLNGDGKKDPATETVLVAPGETVLGTECLLPPPEELGEPACYNGGVNAPASVTREPAANECGNAFHTVVHMTDEWQLVLIPWSELAQWPCPNRLEGGINRAKIDKFEIKLEQGTNYDFWIDNIGFYRRRAGN